MRKAQAKSPMKRLASLSILLVGVALAPFAPASAQEHADASESPRHEEKPVRHDWSFAGAFGRYDKAQLRRGFKVYKEVCSTCHSIKLLAFRNLSQPGGPELSEQEVEALAASYQIKDGPNEQGEYFNRPGRASDTFPPPFPNEQAARAALAGNYPPDFSVLAKARGYSRGFPLFLFDALPGFSYQEHGVDYIVSLMEGYSDPPPDVKLPDGQFYDPYMPGRRIGMPPPLSDGSVTYDDGAPQTLDQYAKDVAAFMMWVAEPHLDARKRIGLGVVGFLIVFAALLYFTKRKIWSKVAH
ncbi:cytochrome c1 [Methylocystis sp. 9N]|uniref:Cytochrome c1 n=2 Tax=Methylocystis borbori TaxID=3118750 RepID=A0ABU7XDE6_9HYPH